MRLMSWVPPCLGLALLLIQPARSSAQCIDYADHLKWMAGIEVPVNPPEHVVIQGNFAYVAGTGGLTILDVTAPENLSIVRDIEIFGERPARVAVSGDHAFFLTWNGLLAFNHTLEDSVIWESGSSLPFIRARDVVVSGDYVFVAADSSQLSVVDVSNLNNIQVVGGLDTQGQALDLTLAGNHLFIANGAAGFLIVDISNPLSPAIVGGCNTPGFAQSVSTSGDVACVADGAVGVQIINMVNMASPFIVKAVDTAADAISVAMAGPYAIVGASPNGYLLETIDLSVPQFASIVGSIPVSVSCPSIALAGNVAYVVQKWFALELVDITHFTSPDVVGSRNGIGSVRGVAASGNHAVVVTPNQLRMIDVSDPQNPSEAGFVGIPGLGSGVAVSGDHAYVTSYEEGMSVIDITNPASPQYKGIVDTPRYAHAVAISGNHAYIADDSLLQVANVSDPTQPVIINSGLDLSALDIVIQGQYAYVARSTLGFAVIDISTPSSLQLVGQIGSLGLTFFVAVDGDYAYTAQLARENAVHVIDISDPANPVVTGSIDLWTETRGIAKRGSYVYVGGGVRVIDVTDPANPTFVGGMVTPGVVTYGLAATDDYLYVGDNWGLSVVSLQCEPTTQPVLFGGLAAREEGRGVMVRWDLYADEPISGFEVYRRALPGGATRRVNDVLLDPSRRSYQDDDTEPGRSYEYFVAAVLPGGDLIRSQTTLVRTRAAELVLYQNHPNPFNPITTISFVLPEKSRARLVVFDVRGMRVRTLLDEDAPAGHRDVTWDGRDDRGVSVASGVYFCELRAGKESVRRKMMLLQ